MVSQLLGPFSSLGFPATFSFVCLNISALTPEDPKQHTLSDLLEQSVRCSAHTYWVNRARSTHTTDPGALILRSLHSRTDCAKTAPPHCAGEQHAPGRDYIPAPPVTRSQRGRHSSPCALLPKPSCSHLCSFWTPAPSPQTQRLCPEPGPCCIQQRDATPTGLQGKPFTPLWQFTSRRDVCSRHSGASAPRDGPLSHGCTRTRTRVQAAPRQVPACGAPCPALPGPRPRRWVPRLGRPTSPAGSAPGPSPCASVSPTPGGLCPAPPGGASAARAPAPSPSLGRASLRKDGVRHMKKLESAQRLNKKTSSPWLGETVMTFGEEEGRRPTTTQSAFR